MFSHPTPIVAALSLVAALLTSPAGDAADWPQFLGPSRNGVVAGAELATSWPESGPSRVFEVTVGEGHGGPVVAADRLIVFHRVGDEEALDCLDAASGERRWRFRAPTTYRDDYGSTDGPKATPAVASGRVFAFGAGGTLLCVDLAQGTKTWSVDTAKEFGVRKGFFGAACSPLVEKDLVLMNVGGAGGAGIVAFDAATGKVRWKATDHEASYSSPVAVTLGGERHALFLTRDGLVDLDPADGAVRFEIPFRARIAASVNAATPIVVGERVFISSSYGVGAALVRVDGSKHETLWRERDALTNHYATSVHRAGFLYGFHGRQESPGPVLRCIELANGAVRWSTGRDGAGTVLLVGGRLLIAYESGEIVLAEASEETFKPLARARVLDGVVRAYPALAGGRLYVRNDSRLVCLDLRASER